jgi:DNA modification methylase
LLIVADARRLPLRDSCVSAVVTSPPYWGLRDYGSADQIGLERTPAAYVASLVAVFREVRRVLVDDGTVWLNLGDSYASGGGAGLQGESGQMADRRIVHARASRPRGGLQGGTATVDVSLGGASGPGLKPKDLIGIPWRVAFALQADGWFLRSDIIWHKPNPMPESVTDRPTKAHEHLFLLAKAERYYYDADAIREAHTSEPWGSGETGSIGPADRGWIGQNASASSGWAMTGRAGNHPGNKRDVWTVATMPYSGAHFATFPEKLIEPCILAGCPVGGLVCDPFVGSGTVGAVAERLGRRWVGTDLSYQPLASARTAQRGLRW